MEESHQSAVIEVGDYEVFLNKLLGRGASGKVYAARHKETKEDAAAKSLHDYDFELLGKLPTEIALLRSLNHQNINTFLAFTEEKDQSTCWVITDFCDEGNLQEYLKKNSSLTEDDRVDIMYQCSDGLAYLHTRDPPVVHRDVKPANILFKTHNGRTVVKIADFGLAKERGDSMFKTHCGTPFFMSPEQHSGTQLYGPPVDVFSTALVFYYVITEKFLTFHGTGNVKALGAAINMLHSMDQPMPAFVEKLERDHGKVRPVKVLIEKMLSFDPNARPQMEDVKHTLYEIQRGIEHSCGSLVLSEGGQVVHTAPAQSIWQTYVWDWIRNMFYRKHVVQMVARQKRGDLSSLYIDCVRKEEVRDLLKSLKEDGFTEGPRPSKECVMEENTDIKLSFTGDLTADFTETVQFHPTMGTCMQEVFVDTVDDPSMMRRGYLVFTELPSGKEFCKLPISLGKGQHAAGGGTLQITRSCSSRDLSLMAKDKKFMFATKCVLSCPVALRKWRDLADKLDMLDAVEQLAHTTVDTLGYESCQKLLDTWYHNNTNKLLAMQQLKQALLEIGATNAHEGLMLLDEEHSGSGTSTPDEDEQLFHKAMKIILSNSTALREWRAVGRELGLQPSILADIEHRTVNSLQEACRNMLTEWYDRMGRTQDTISKLISAMHDTQLNSVADDIQRLLL